jgi:cysteine-rich repeat protein
MALTSRPVVATSVAVLGLLLAPLHASAFVDLTAGKRLKAKSGATPQAHKITIRIASDPNLLTIPQSPLCPTQTTVTFVTDTGSPAQQVLDCANWTVVGTGFRYYETPAGAGSLRKITYKPGKLVVTLKGAPYSDAAVGGPVAFLETRIAIGATEYCARWAQPPGELLRNEPEKIVVKGPTSACQTDCGNGVIEAPEQCDDGNATSGDGCDANCTTTGCGNGIVTGAEACDDGDATSGDGCDANCTPTGCGNGITTGSEICDDGNATSGDGCDANCTPTACGNGIVTGAEGCDDGNGSIGDGCRPDCTPEVCGDGIHDPQEACDDSNTMAGDCCAPNCVFEAPGGACTDDGNPCTDDGCDGAGTCVHPANADPCTDLDGCTIGDVCSAGQCVGTLRQPWINEIDYDDFFGALDDRDEFVEIAGPAGTDLSGYRIFSVEGGPSGTCLTPHVAPFAAIGEANMGTVIPNGAVLGDDTGTGIGFLTVCFTFTSANIVNLPACDVVLPAPRTDSNLFNGYLLNTNETTCPDGVLLLDADDGYVDSVSYEGVVPDVGTYGPYFHLFAPYSAPRDEGWLVRVSIEKTSSTLERAASAAEWRDPSEVGACVGQQGTGCVSATSTPGTVNPLQALACGSPSPAFLDERIP